MRARTKKIWITLLAIVLFAYAALAFIATPQVPPVYIVSTSIHIDAPPEKVWNLLMATEDYARWNPYLTNIEGSLKPGQRLAVTLVDANFPEPLVVNPTVQAVEPLQRFYWSGTFLIPGLVDTRHFFELQAQENGTTRVVQYEEFRGLIAMLLPNREQNMTNTKNAFHAMHEAMKSELE